uniref:Pyridoxal kinase n=1 Tax=Lynceus sp. MCZ IZ 141354 TaxID=1930659 RepID=A0A9N6ZEN0_9CRUS|nr:EOG090X09AY [Lynceus sp. MCZ IZ 141354]
MGDQIKKVLSIQSHVVSGYVGNKSASFPLQVLGFEVDAVNSVQFSNHTGYGKWTGTILNSNELSDLIEGLRINDLLNYSHILTGYVGSVSFLNQLYDVIRELKSRNPNITYVCDPVLGDNGKLYVPAELIPIYRDKILPLADIATPNQFEAELLTGTEINTEEEAKAAVDLLHAKGVGTVVISSSDLSKQDVSLTAFISAAIGGEKYRIDIPRLPYIFTGTGDLFSALLLAWMNIHEGQLRLAFEKTVCTLQDVLHRTSNYAAPNPSKKNLELRLVQSKDDIEKPKTQLKAVPW